MTILVVEDEIIVGLALQAEFADLGLHSRLEADAESALRALDAETFRAAVIDIGLPGIRGDRLAKICRERFPSMPVVLATGMQEREVSTQFIGDPGVLIVEKPHHFTALRECLEKLGALSP